MKSSRIAASLLAALMLVSCAAETTPSDTDSVTETAQADRTEREMCTVHHSSYHSIPTELALYVGENETTEWITARDPESTDDGDGCPCSERNIKAFIDDFDIPREVFAAKADLSHYATLDCELLYSGSREEIDAYFRDTEALRHKSVRAQHFSFLEHLIVSDYPDEATAAIVKDSTGAHGSTPSVPQLASLLGISREKLEEYIAQADTMTEQTCGELLSYDYDLDMIYDSDGAYRTLPDTGELSEYDRILVLNRIFCAIGA